MRRPNVNNAYSYRRPIPITQNYTFSFAVAATLLTQLTNSPCFIASMSSLQIPLPNAYLKTLDDSQSMEDCSTFCKDEAHNPCLRFACIIIGAYHVPVFAPLLISLYFAKFYIVYYCCCYWFLEFPRVLNGPQVVTCRHVNAFCVLSMLKFGRAR